MQNFSTYVNEIGFSGRSVRNVDPIQMMIRNILSGEFKLNMVDKQPDMVKRRILGDIKLIVKGPLHYPIWLPAKFKLSKKRAKDLETQMKRYK